MRQAIDVTARPLECALSAVGGHLSIGRRRVDTGTLHNGDIVECDGHFFMFSRTSTSSWPTDSRQSSFETLSQTLQLELSTLSRVARSPLPVMISGETGTGKEVVARAVHQQSGRRGRFVPVNCGALVDTLAQSEFFGHRRGAFSGAVTDSVGYVRQADEGTLFLDEVAELPVPIQASLLRVLQEHEVTPVGDTSPVRVDFRVITATNRNLKSMVATSAFREDLYARLAGYEIELPPLRDRPEDIGLLVRSIIRRHSTHPGSVSMLVDTAWALLEYSWPMNVRELDNAIATALILSGNGVIEPAHLPKAVRLNSPPDRTGSRERSDPRKAELITLLQRHAGNITAISAATGKARMQVHRWMRRYNLRADDFRSRLARPYDSDHSTE
jgi:DNA-binding NtrC family response regulator